MRHILIILFSCFSLFSCVSQKASNGYQSFMLFKGGESFSNDEFNQMLAKAEQNYKIQKFDQLYIEVFTNNGEWIIDPNREIENNPDRDATNGGGNRMIINRADYLRKFEVDQEGNISLPVVNKVNLEGKTLQKAMDTLQQLYSTHYVNPYVLLKFFNKRCVVMGALGNHIVPLKNENTSLLEVIALAGNLDNTARADKIRLLRGTSSDMVYMQEIDLTTFEGLRKAELIIQPNDVVYIEPRRKIGREILTDVTTVIGAITSSLSLVLTTWLLFDRISGGN